MIIGKILPPWEKILFQAVKDINLEVANKRLEQEIIMHGGKDMEKEFPTFQGSEG
jgi:hypothetical protein